MELKPGCLGAFGASLIGGVIGVVTLGLDGLSLLVIVLGMWWMWAVASALVRSRDVTPVSEAVGAFFAVVPWIALWLVAELASRDTAFRALAVADGLAALGIGGLFGLVVLRYLQSGGRFGWLGGVTRRVWSFDLEGARHSVEVDKFSLLSGRPQNMVFDGTGIPIRWRRVSPVWSYWAARHEFTFHVAGRVVILKCERRAPPLSERLRIAATNIDEESHWMYRLLIGERDLGSGSIEYRPSDADQAGN